MKPRHTIRLIAAMVGLLVCRAEAAELDYYQRFSSLIDTNRSGGPVLTNGMLSLSELKRRPEIVGVKLGMTMSAAVEHWGKPRNFYANDAGGPLLLFHHGALGFQGDKAVRIGIFTTTIPGLRFDGGLTVTNSPADFAKVLGLPAADPAQRPNPVKPAADGSIEPVKLAAAALYRVREMPGDLAAVLRENH